jgi:cytochrome b subunit of formate dehydrogenase
MAEIAELETPAPEVQPRAAAVQVRHVRRFDRADRYLHFLMMCSFLGLAGTGLPLLFNEAPWAKAWARALGGFEFGGTVHRIFAVILIGVFVTHISRLLHRVMVKKDYSIFWGPSSMVPQPRDIKDLLGHFKWFVGAGPRPVFDRFTYWEKFDYWAVFWGMAIIGGSGLMLWFPELFARVLPGWLFNIALLVHGEEALLAVGFIFTIHFFNGHIRPEKFPMDMVIFTGSLSEAELRHERPAEHERLRRTGGIDRLNAGPPSHRALVVGRFVGTCAVIVGLTLVVLIVYAFLTR